MTQIQQHRLEWSHVPVWLYNRVPDGIGGAIGLGDRPVQHRDAIPTLQISCVRQNEIGIVHHLAGVSVRVDDFRNDVFAIGVLACKRLDRIRHIHRRIPAHVGHIHEQHINTVGVALGGIVDHHMHHAVRGQRRIP